jgi:hypothetical protein
MDGAKEDARAEGNGAGRGASVESSEQTAQGGNDAAPVPSVMPSNHDLDGYVTAGLQLIPLHRWNARDAKGRQRGKSPRDGAWQARKYDSRGVIDDAKRTGINVGVRLAADWLVIDVDPRNFPEGRDSLAELVAATGLELANAPHTCTGGGGHHYWFRKPAGVTLLDSLEAYPGVEFKSLGRQVVAAGSLHPNGTRYELDDFAPPVASAPPAPLPLIEMARRPQRAATASSNCEAGELTPQLLAETLEQLDPCDFGEHGEWLNLMMACHHATAGEAREEFIEWSTQDPKYADDGWIIGRRWDSLHVDRGGERSITVKYLHKVLQDHGGQVARPDAADDFETWTADAVSHDGERWRFLSVEELEALPPPSWLVPELLTEGSLAAIFGQPESFKSFLALDISLSIAAHMPWHGRQVPHGGVLYIAGEGAPGLGKRVRAWRTQRQAHDRKLSFQLMRDEINLAGERDSDVRDFVGAVKQRLGSLRLIVIDTLNQTAAGADENSAKDMGRYAASMKRLRDATGATVMVVHHSGKDLSKGMRGSNALLAAMDTTVEVERPSDAPSIIVSVRKQKDADRGSPMRFNLDRVGDSLVLKATVIADAAADFREQFDPIVDLAREMAAAAGGRLPLKELVGELMKRQAMADKTARRKIDESIGMGNADAAHASDGSTVWLERVGKNPRGELLVCTTREVAG